MEQTTSSQSRHFGAEVAARIQAAGLTYDDIFVRTGIAKATLHRRLMDPAGGFTVPELRLIATVLGTTAGTLVTEIDSAA